MCNNQLQQAVLWACQLDVDSLKVGNVSIYRQGHGMHKEEFIRSAHAIAPLITRSEWSIGERILACVEATQKAVNKNTNLGIILLVVPLVAAAQHPQKPFIQSLAHLLRNLTIKDAEYTYQAIRLARPEGLGQRTKYDVYTAPTESLYTIMQDAQQEDKIAYQYANAYQDIFTIGLPAMYQGLHSGLSSSWSTSYLYIQYLSRFLDSHIVRKYGENTAIQVQTGAKSFQKYLRTLPTYYKQLMHFDEQLKVRQINPGTTADLTVATLLTAKMCHYI